jgi:hypothetical protein
MSNSRKSICEGMVLAMELAKHAPEVVSVICDSICVASPERTKSLLYLLNDILFNAVKVTNAWVYKQALEAHMPELMERFG